MNYLINMIRGGSFLLLGVVLLATLALATFENIEVSSVDRSVKLDGSYPIETIKVKFIANEDDISYYSYLTPLDYDSKISRIYFPPSAKDKGSLSYERSVYIHVFLEIGRME